MSNHYALILCGGSGTRLWPLSRSLRPKQLLAQASHAVQHKER
jgi:mannose-1-phosphate guanylyltransferase